MKLNYYPETDSLYIELNGQAGVETREVGDGINVDLAGDGTVVGIDIDGASRKLDLEVARDPRPSTGQAESGLT